MLSVSSWRPFGTSLWSFCCIGILLGLVTSWFLFPPCGCSLVSRPFGVIFTLYLFQVFLLLPLVLLLL